MFASGSRTADERGPQSRPNLPMEIASLPTGTVDPRVTRESTAR